MQLTSHTDYALRVLMVLGAAAPFKVRTAQIGEMFDISEHHLVKIIQNLARHGYVETVRGKAGGVRLARCASDINVGQVVREMEAELGVVPCLQREGAECFITPVCGLKVALAQATSAFLSSFDTNHAQTAAAGHTGRRPCCICRQSREPTTPVDSLACVSPPVTTTLLKICLILLEGRRWPCVALVLPSH